MNDDICEEMSMKIALAGVNRTGTTPTTTW
jgi:hypothetical protein